jgi:5-oxoprolinase (ATP-hydrolysing)
MRSTVHWALWPAASSQQPAASSQQTMNNFTFGDVTHPYCETISGGSGAGVVRDDAGRIVGGFHGTSVVQTHMTNSRLTDPEVLELRFPVRLDSCAIRHHGAFGVAGGQAGAPGINRVERADGHLEPLDRPPRPPARARRASGRAWPTCAMPNR